MIDPRTDAPEARPPLLLATRERPAIHLVHGAVFTPPREDAPDTDDEAPVDDDSPLGALLLSVPRARDNDPPGSDDPPVDLGAPIEEGVTLAPEGGEPVSAAAFRARVVDACLDTIAMLARNRAFRPARARPSSEARILEQADAIVATGAGSIDVVFAWWERAASSPDPWKSWAPIFVLGSIAGEASIEAIVHGLARLPGDARDAALVAAEALAVVAHPGVPRLGERLLGASHPVSFAVGIDVASRSGALSEERIARLLGSGDTLVAEAAVRAAERLPSLAGAPAVTGALLDRTRRSSGAVAARSARLLALRGFAEPILEAREGTLLARTGGAALELFVLAGVAADLAVIEPALSRLAVTPEILSTLGRFGHPGAWPFLVHQLADEDLAGDAALALATIFGDAVPAKEQRSAAAWRSALAARRIDPDRRHRRGEPWRVEAVMAECSTGSLPRVEIARRVDEITARLGLRAPVDLCLWTPEPERQLAALGQAASQAARGLTPGDWR